jgi:hypothetical protein
MTPLQAAEEHFANYQANQTCLELRSRLKSQLLRPNVKRSGTKDDDMFGTFGTEELCTWRVAPGVCRFQTTRPDFARKLSQRSGARLVSWSISGGYLRIFDESIEPWRARHLVKRYLKATNGAFSSRIRAASASGARGSLCIAGGAA